MASRFRIVATATLFLSIAASPAVRADTITVASGNAGVVWDDPPFMALHGEGFNLFTAFFLVPVSPQRMCFAGCAPRTAVNLSAVFGGTTGEALVQAQVAMVNGVTYAIRNQPQTWLILTGQLFFDAPNVVLPDVTPLPPDARRYVDAATAPFSFRGEVAGWRSANPEHSPLFRVSLIGHGTATLRMIGENGVWTVPEAFYTFEEPAPVPEPMSILLLATGLSGLALRSRHGRR